MLNDIKNRNDEWTTFLNEPNAENVAPIEFLYSQRDKVLSEIDKKTFMECCKAIIL